MQFCKILEIIAKHVSGSSFRACPWYTKDLLVASTSCLDFPKSSYKKESDDLSRTVPH